MRLTLFILSVFIPFAVYADVPKPALKPNISPPETPISQIVEEKPQQSSFQDVIDKAVQSVKRELPMDEDDDENGMIVPPPMPLQKKIDVADTKIVHGIPLPTRKPFKVIATKSDFIKQVEEIPQRGIIYYEGDHSDRTAGGSRPRTNTQQRQRIYAERVGRLKEARAPSPFKSETLPKAKGTSSRDPVIIFFQEYSSELEVGQMDVLKNDVLAPLRRSKSSRAILYGYAIKQRSKPDEERRLSLSRALMIREYLIDNRIDAERIEVRSMGDDTPIEPKNRVDIVLD
jgi:outer membrane protein OmpA-like peptidoglycan-associated protein